MTIVLQKLKYFYPKWYVLGSGSGRALSRSINRPLLARFLLAKSWHGSCIACAECMGRIQVMQIKHYSLGAIFCYDIHSFTDRGTRDG